jgi:hypothetical protein
VIEAEPIAPRRLKADIPPDLETICLKCLEKSPSARYSSARALAEELDRFLKGEPIQARPASALRKTVSWARRHPGVLAAVTALVVIALAIGVFYLFEENRFLRASLADPTLARVAGLRQEYLRVASAFGYIAAVAGIFLWFTVLRKARGLSWRAAGPLDPPTRPLQPLDQRTRDFAIGGGLIVVGYGVVVLAMTIQAHVWEGESIVDNLLPTYCLVYFGLCILGLVIRDYRLIHHGVPANVSRELTAEQIEPMRRALEAHSFAAAVERYREAVPEAGVPEARQYVIRLFGTLRAEEPEKFAPPPLSLATLNGNAVLICAAIEAAVLAVLWLTMPPARPASAVSQFAYSLLFGMGLMAVGRVKGSRKVLLLAPSLVVMILSEMIVPRLAGSSSHSIAVYVCGFFFGIFLTVSAFTPRRRRA